MANLMFKYGSYASLPAIVDGQILVTTDEKAMYVDLGGVRHRISDTIVYPSYTDFAKLEMPPKHPDAFYYIENENALFRWIVVDGKGSWKQVNSTADIAADLEALELTVGEHTTSIGTINGQITDLIAEDARIEGLFSNYYTKDEVDSAIDADVLVETNRAKAAEEALDDRIDGVIASAAANASAITNLQTKDSDLEKAISDEAARAKAAEEANAKAISDEATRADTEEKRLAGLIEANTNSIALKADASALQAEINRATQAEEDLGDRINDILADSGLGGRVTALETKVGNATSGLVKAVSDLQAEDIVIKEDIAGINTTLGTKASTSDLNSAINSVRTDFAAADSTINSRIDSLSNVVGDSSNGLVKDVADLKTTVGNSTAGLVADVAANASAIAVNAGNIANKAEQSALEAEVNRAKAAEEDLQDQINAITGGEEGLGSRVAALETEVSNLKNDINDSVKADISDLKTDLATFESTVANTYVNNTTYNTKIAEIEGNVSDNASAISEIEGDIADINSAANTLKGRVDALEPIVEGHTTTLAGHASRIEAAEKGIEDLEALVGTLPEGTSATNVVDYIDAQFAAADAMKYMGGIKEYADLTNLVAAEVEAGHTYVVEEDFVYEGESFYAGDLVVAKVDGDNSQWTHVATGYQASQEAKLSGSDNAIKLTSVTGVSLGSVAVEGNGVKAEVADNKLSITLEWGSF